MTIALDMAALSPRSVVPGQGGVQTGDDAGLDFAALLNGRALLDAAAGMADGSQHHSAPAARRFDEASLFGQAYLAMRLAPDAIPESIGASSISGTGSAGPEAAVTESVASDPAKPTGWRPSGGGAASPDAAWGAGLQAHLDRPAAGLEARAFSVREKAQDVLQGVGRGMAAVAGGQVPIPRMHSMRPVFAPPPRGEPATADSSADKANEARARSVHQLGPVHLVLREEGSALYPTARVATLAPGGEDELERRLRKVVGEEGLQLGTVQINGRERPAPARG